MLKEDLGSIKSSNKDVRNFGLLVGGAFLLLGMLTLFRGRATGEWFAGTGIALIAAGLFAVGPLRPLQKLWMMFAVVLGFITTRIILFAAFFLILTPLGIVARITGKKHLDRKPDPAKPSYWIRKDAEEERRYEEQY